jgi:hypothetical protein
MKPLRFTLAKLEKVLNPTLHALFEIKKRELLALRVSEGSAARREYLSFHGTRPANLNSVLQFGVLRHDHALLKTQGVQQMKTDGGWFGAGHKGIYVSPHPDYTLKYSQGYAIDEGSEVAIVMLRTMPGKCKHIPHITGGIDPTPGFDSHSSPNQLEWYLFDEAQACPAYVATVKAVADTKYASDDK